MPILTQEQFDRFDLKTEVDHESGCIVWTGCIKRSGYGCVSIARKLHYAHRIAYERANGTIPAGLVIDHTCRNKRCVNPEHLQTATTKQNAENLKSVTGSISGLRGVHFDKTRNQFRVRVKHEGRVFYGGYFHSADEANGAAVELRNKLFTNNILDRT